VSSRPERTRRTRRSRLAFLLLGVCLPLAAMEGVLRALDVAAPRMDTLRLPGHDGGPGQTRWDPKMYYSLRPGERLFDRYAINGRGYRGPDVPQLKPPGTLRLAATGDSSTFGLGVADEETWPARTGAILTALLSGLTAVDVVNAGVPGYSTEHNRRQLARDLLPLQPDVVAVCPTGANDTVRRGPVRDREVLTRSAGPAGYVSRVRLLRVLGFTGLDDVLNPPRGDRRDWVRRVELHEFEENLRSMGDLCREAGLPFVLVSTPPCEMPGHPAPDELLQCEAAVAAAARAGVGLLADARPAFDQQAPLDLFSDGTHFRPVGQAAIAQAVVASLVEQPVLTVAAPRQAFLNAWSRSRREGVAPHLAALLHGDRPPLFVTLLAALQSEGIDERIARGDPALPAELREHDPLLGRRRGPYGSGALRLAAAAAERAGQPAEAAERLAQAEEVERCVRPEDPLLARLGGVAALPQLTPIELAVARALSAFDAAAGALPWQRDARVPAARQALLSGDPAGALHLLDQALRLAPDQQDARYERVLALRRLGRGAEAEVELQAAIDLDPQAPLALFAQGWQHLAAGERGQAEAQFRVAIAADPTLARARAMLARLLIDRGELDEAETELHIAAMLINDPVDVRPLLAEIAAARRTSGSGPPQDG